MAGGTLVPGAATAALSTPSVGRSPATRTVQPPGVASESATCCTASSRRRWRRRRTWFAYHGEFRIGSPSEHGDALVELEDGNLPQRVNGRRSRRLRSRGDISHPGMTLTQQ